MEILVTFVTRRAKGGVSRKTEEKSAEALHFGRSTQAEIYLADPRVRFDHAAIHQRPGGLFIEGEKLSDIRVNGAPSRSRLIKAGDVVGIGPYDVTLVEPPEGKDIAVEVELVRPLGDDLARLAERSTIRLADYGLSRRLWSWFGILTILLLFLALPVMYFYQHTELSAGKTVEGTRPDMAWVSGPVSSPHKFISDQCNTCHQKPFVQVQDSACLSCHKETAHHFDAAKPELASVPAFKAMVNNSCENCHKEHNGDSAISVSQQSFCVDCHAGIEKILPAASIKNAGNFDSDHPEFRPRVVTDSASGKTAAISMDDTAALQERSGLKFPHDKHLAKEGIRGPKEKEILNCASCHTPQGDGASFVPIQMETTCERCHQLRFEPRRPDRALPHGRVNEAQLLLREFYSDYALRGGLDDAAIPAPDTSRRRPGEQAEITPAEQSNPRAWADMKARQVANQTFGKTMCGNCHEVAFGPEQGPLGWSVVPASVTSRWLPRGRFDHASHSQQLECGACHKAETSARSSDVLLPKVAVCKECHGGEEAANKVPSTCISCHDFHLPGMPKMTGQDAGKASGAGDKSATGAVILEDRKN